MIAIDAFCGAGGLSLGLIQAGFQIGTAFDNDSIAIQTYTRNIGEHAVELDARVIAGRDLMERVGLHRGECGLLAGGPPCQGFSLQRRGERDDPRNQLVLRFMQLIEEILPKAFLMENVPAISSIRGRYLLEKLTEATAANYEIVEETLDAFDYGVAQHRRRTFVVGVRRDAPLVFKWPDPSSGGPRTVRDAIGDLPSPPADGFPHPTVANHYREARLSQINIERIRHVPPGGGREHLPPELRLRCHANGHRHLDTYGRLAWEEPSVTITARFDSFTRGRFGHPDEDRSLTLREGARLQGFPDDFSFLGSREDGARLIGNAVPPPLARAIGKQLLEAWR